MDSRPAARTFLKHGVYNSYKNGCRCDPCKEAYSTWKKARVVTLPFDQLLTVMTKEQKVSHANLIAAKTGGTISLFHADKLCCKFGYHPWQVYGDLYFRDIWEKDEQAKAEGDSGRKCGR